MNTLRLFVDGVGHGWVIVRCERCADINKYDALAAFDAPTSCVSCGYVMHLRDGLMTAVKKSARAPRELIRAISRAGAMQAAGGAG
ncbi:MAG: hypothetical protein ABI831_08890 [Betaproteobacteria bacterium]